MKRLIILTLLISSMVVSVNAGKKPSAFNKTPKSVQKAILVNYTPEDVLLVTSQKEIGYIEYTLILSDETKLKYDEKGQLHEAKNIVGIKEALIPSSIIKYVKKTFPNATITEYEYERSKQDVTLNDKLELVFDKHGKFLRIDD